jgi:urea ABC transporter permease protein UrtB/urea ABC transporter permease protein UrtC
VCGVNPHTGLMRDRPAPAAGPARPAPGLLMPEPRRLHAPAPARRRYRTPPCRTVALVATLLLLLAPAWSGYADVEAEGPDAALAAEAKAQRVLDAIVTAVGTLDDRDRAEATVRDLIALQDVRVKRFFERVVAQEVYLRDGAPVWASSMGQEAGGELRATLHPLLAERRDDGAVDAEVEATVPFAELTRLRVNRRALNLMRDALAVIGLEVDDPRERLRSAIDVGNKRQAQALPLLRRLADADPDAAVRRAASESAALMTAAGADPAAGEAEVAAAIVRLGELQSVRALGMLREQAGRADLPASQRAALHDAIPRIERHVMVTNRVKDVFFGLSLGSILVLIALGLAITFGLMGVINMAHGEMLMIGAITTWATFVFLHQGGRLFTWLPGLALLDKDWAYVVAFPLAFGVAALTGLIVEQTIVRFLYKRPLDSLLATIGVSYILIQLVRNWKGDNLALVRPDWAGGQWEVMRNVSLSYARLFLIGLSAFCVVSVVVLFRFTRVGLMLRATAQNREMAQSLGVNTRRVDALTFAFGSGLAGLAGFGLYLINSVSPQMGQGYIVTSFLVVVVGGVGNLAGVVISGLGIGSLQKLLEPWQIIQSPLTVFDATWAEVAVLALVILFIQRRPGGLFPEKGRMADQADRSATPWGGRPSWRTDTVMGVLLLVVGLVVIPGLYLAGVLSLDDLNRYGYFITFAICAVGLDLLWGYVGVLSLCQFLFFALGAYAMGFYLINHGPKTAGIPDCLYYVMSGTGELTAPWYLVLFESLPVAFVLALVLPGLAAGLIGVIMFRSRVKGVYFAILTQTLTVIALRIFEKNELKMGGTNGVRITFTEELFGHPIAAQAGLAPLDQTRFKLYVLSVVGLAVAVGVAKYITWSRFGRVLRAIRDDETRLRFSGYKTWMYKAGVFAVAGMLAGLGGALYMPQKGIITPGDMAPFWSILVVAWVAVGGRGTVWGAVIGAVGVSAMYTWMTTNYPAYWMFALGALFILVPLLLPGGLMSLPKVAGAWRRRLAASAGGGAS